jgi:hypothetical protein
MISKKYNNVLSVFTNKQTEIWLNFNINFYIGQIGDYKALLGIN